MMLSLLCLLPVEKQCCIGKGNSDEKNNKPCLLIAMTGQCQWMNISLLI